MTRRVVTARHHSKAAHDMDRVTAVAGVVTISDQGCPAGGAASGRVEGNQLVLGESNQQMAIGRQTSYPIAARE